MRLLSQTIFSQNNVYFQGDWSEKTLEILDEASNNLFSVISQPMEGWEWFKNLVIRAENIPQLGLTSKGLVRLNPGSLSQWTVVHEFAHAWDFATGLRLSRRMKRFTHSWGPVPILHLLSPDDNRFWYHVGSMPPPCGSDKHFNRLEDFAEAVAAYVYPEEARKRAADRGMAYDRFGYASYYETPRGQFIKGLIAGKPTE